MRSYSAKAAAGSKCDRSTWPCWFRMSQAFSPSTCLRVTMRRPLGAPGDALLGRANLLLGPMFLGQLAHGDQANQAVVFDHRQTPHLLEAHAFQRLVTVLVGAQGSHVRRHH